MGMAAVGLRFWTELTRRWRTWLGLAVVIGVVAGIVLTLVAGARRTDSAYRRFLGAERAYDVLVIKDAASFIEDAPPGPPLDPARIAKLPGVTEAASAKYFFAFIGSGVGVFVPPDGRLGNALNRFKLLAGRRPDRANPAEVVVGFTFAELYGVHVGDQIPLLETGLIDHAPPDTPPKVLVAAARAKARILAVLPGGKATVVGIEAAPGEFPPQIEGTNRFLIHASPALTAMVPDLIRFNTGGDAVAVRLAGGDRGVDRFLASLGGSDQHAASAGGSSIQRDVTAVINRSVHTQASALWLLALLTAAAGVLVGSQLLARVTAVESDDQPVLAALGMVRRDRFMLGLVRAAGIGVAAGAVAVALAVAASPLFPMGLAGKAEPSSGFRFDGVLALGGLAVVAIVVVLTLWPSWVAASRTLGSGAADSGPRRSSMMGRVLTHLPVPPSIELGVRMALEPGRGRSSVPVRSTLTAVTLGVASLVAALVFAASLGHLLATPALYGQSWDAELTTYDQVIATQGLPVLRANPRVEGLAVGSIRDRFTIRGRRVDGLAIDSVKGGLAPTILEGHGPEADNEIVVGTRTMRDLGLRIGDHVDVSPYLGAGFSRAAGDSASQASMRVVGRAVFPVFAEAGQLGDGVYVTRSGGVRIAGAGTSYPSALVRLNPDTKLDDVTGALEAKFGGVAVIRQGKPTDIVDFGQAKQTPYLLGALLGAVAVFTLIQLLVTATRRRRRDLAVVRALGFVQRQVRMAVTWQALTLVGIALVVGLPVGIAAGSLLWRRFADNLGVITEVELRPAVFLLIAVGGLLVAFVLAVLPARAAARTPLETTLRSE